MDEGSRSSHLRQNILDILCKFERLNTTVDERGCWLLREHEALVRLYKKLQTEYYICLYRCIQDIAVVFVFVDPMYVLDQRIHLMKEFQSQVLRGKKASLHALEYFVHQYTLSAISMFPVVGAPFDSKKIFGVLKDHHFLDILLRLRVCTSDDCFERAEQTVT